MIEEKLTEILRDYIYLENSREQILFSMLRLLKELRDANQITLYRKVFFIIWYNLNGQVIKSKVIAKKLLQKIGSKHRSKLTEIKTAT